MPQPNNRYDLLRQKKNNFKRQSFYVQANGVAPPVTPPALLLPVFGVPAAFSIPRYNLNLEESINIYPVETTSFTVTSTLTSVSESGTVDIILDTTGLSNSYIIGFTITGIQPGDIDMDAANLSARSDGTIYGYFNVSNNTSTVTLDISADNTTEGEEVITLLLDNGKDSVDIAIQDTSTGATTTTPEPTTTTTTTPEPIISDFVVTVDADTIDGSRFVINGDSNFDLELQRGTEYTFDVGDGSNTGHTLSFSEEEGSFVEANGISRSGDPGTYNSSVRFTPDYDVGELYMYSLEDGDGFGDNYNPVPTFNFKLGTEDGLNEIGTESLGKIDVT